jgi:hypothetical protein
MTSSDKPDWHSPDSKNWHLWTWSIANFSNLPTQTWLIEPRWKFTRLLVLELHSSRCLPERHASECNIWCKMPSASPRSIIEERRNYSSNTKFMSGVFWFELRKSNRGHFCSQYSEDYEDDVVDTTPIHPRKGRFGILLVTFFTLSLISRTCHSRGTRFRRFVTSLVAH